MNRTFVDSRLIGAAAALALLSCGLPAAQRTQADETAVPAPRTPPAAKLSGADRARVEALGRDLVTAIRAEHDSTRRRLTAEIYDTQVVAEIGIERLVQQMVRIRESFPGLEYHHSELAETVRGDQVTRVLHIYARQPGQTMWRDLQVYVASNPPHRLKQLAFIAEVTEPIYLPNGAITDPTTLEWLGEYVERLVQKYDLSGALLVAEGDRVIFERYFGYADVERRRAVDSTTLFSLASASKMFTALGVARLVADGRLSYSDSVGRFFPDYPDPAFLRRVTVGQLLSHTSGVAEYWTKENVDALRTVSSTTDLLPLVYGVGHDFEPGARFQYSNSNYVLAGLIVEKVTGESYSSVIRREITVPLGMKETGDFVAADSKLPIAQALYREGDRWAARPRGNRGTAAGGWYSTPRDMLRFMRGLHEGRVLTPKDLEPMLVSKTSGFADAGMDYGYGFELQRAGGVDSYGHGGITGGVNSEVRHFRQPDVTLVVFGNQDNGAYDDLRKNVSRLITGDR